MCEAEEVLNWLIDEVALKSKEATECRRAVRRATPWDSFLPREVSKALDLVDDFESDLRELVREARQRLKESKQKAAA